MRKLAELTAIVGPEVVARSTPSEPPGLRDGLAVVLGAGSRLRPGHARRSDPKQSKESPGGSVDFHINPIKAIVPVLPLVLLFADSSLGVYSPLRSLEGPPKILAAMLIGIVLAGADLAPRRVGQLGTAFFEGAGYAYTHVISLIVAASTFAEGIRQQRPDRDDGQGAGRLADRRRWSSARSPPGRSPSSRARGSRRRSRSWSSSCPVAATMHLDPVRLGTVAALGSHFGRTMSPAAAVVAMSAKLAYVPPSQLIRQVTPPLLIGGVVLLAAAILQSHSESTVKS